MAEEKEQTPAAGEVESLETAAEENQETSEKDSTVEADALTPEERELLQLQENIEKLEIDNADMKDQLLRKQADFDNFRKRMFRDKEDAIKYANSNLLADLVSVIDDFERAIGSAESSKDFDSFLSGFRLIEKQFVGMLERNWGLKRMDLSAAWLDRVERVVKSIILTFVFDFLLASILENSTGCISAILFPQVIKTSALSMSS
mgnify:CR=1 FL=1